MYRRGNLARVAAMGDRSSYTPGTFCWVELSTSDQDAAKAFYGELFGWENEDNPVGDGMYYSMQSVGGKNVAAIATQPQQQAAAGVPPLWNSYVSVDNADEVAARASELGATVHAPPFDVMDAGRMAVLQDPQGAHVMLWQPAGHYGAALVNAPSAFCWNELYSPDIDASTKFYGDLFGWTYAPFEGSPMRYEMIQNQGNGNGGITGLPMPEVPPHWLAYFAVEDIDAALAKLEQLGGTKLMGPQDIGVAKIAVVQDPQGASFALYAGQLVD
jgi:predicted enzyme related to lactoylglutathione lyase